MPDEAKQNSAQRTERLGKYEILGHIATGGMGVIYKARDIDLDRLVALKILPAEMAKQSTTLIRFRREAKAAALLRHENIVTIFDVGEENGTHFIALEYIEGTDLQFYITRNCRLDVEEVRQILIQATRALVHAHEHKVVHRDIKPSNLLLMHKDKKLIVKLTDFGLAIRHENDADFRVTRDKTTVGTVDYMSPEQARDSRLADIRSDIYSLGCTAYHMLVGNAPFARGSLPERIVQHMKAPPPDMRKLNKSVPAYLVAVINRMLAKKPDNRYQTPTELLFDLEHPDQVDTTKPAPAARKTAPAKVRKKSDDPTAVIENGRAEESEVEPQNVKVTTARRIPAAERSEHADDWAESAAQEGTGRKGKRPKKKSESNAYVTYLAVAAVGFVVLLLLAVMIASNRQPPKKDIDKPIDRPPVVRFGPKVDPEPEFDTTPAKMTVPELKLPIMDVPPEKADAVALHREFAGALATFPSETPGVTVLRVSRLVDAAPGWFVTLEEALAKTRPDEFSVIEIHDNGPIFVPALPSLNKRAIVIRGANGYRPLIVWDIPKKTLNAKTPLVFASLIQGKLILENLDFVMQPVSSTPAVVFDIPDTDFYTRNCTFSLAGKGVPSVVLARRIEEKSTRKTQTWLHRTFVRGPEVTLLDLQGASSEILIEKSLVAGQHQPLIRIRGREEEPIDLRLIRSTLVVGQTFLRWQSIGGKGATPVLQGWALDSIISRDDPATSTGDMIELADGAEASKLRWRAVNSVYSGWKQLLASGTKSIAGHDIDAWHRQWVYSDGDRALVDAWPSTPPSALEEQPADAFSPAQSPLAFAALTGPGAAGSVAGWLPSAPTAWLERLFEPRAVAAIPPGELEPPIITQAEDGLYHGEQLDLNKVDLGAHLTAMLQQKPAGPRVVLHLSGKGVCASTPLRIKGVQHLILYADPKEPLLLDINPANIAYPAAAIEMSGGRLELIGVRLRVNPATPMPAMIHMQDGDVTLTRCTLLGPLYKPTDSFQTLIFMSNSAAPPTTLLMRDNVLLSAKRLIHLQDHVELRARNNLGVSLGSAMVFDATRPTADVTHVLDHNTIAARNNVFWLRTGPGFYPARQVRMHASSNAFLTPFLEGSDQRVLVRGADSWNRSGRWSWQGRYNVYDNRLHAFFVTGAKGAAPKQTLRDWQNVWGQVGEFEAHPLDVGALAKALQADSPAIANLPTLLDRLALPRSIRGDPDQSPPGADLWSLGIAKKKN